MQQKTKILIVDGDSTLREELARGLRMDGHEVFETADGVEGLRVFDERHPGLVVLSLQLRDMDGLQLCQIMKWRSAGRKTYVMLLSDEPLGGFETLDRIAHAPDDFLLKPVSPVGLLARARLALRPPNNTEVLRNNREFHSRLLEDLTKAILLLTLRGRLLGASPKALDLLGYADQSELVERSALGLVEPHERQRFSSLLASTLAAESSGDQKFIVLRKQGESLPVRISTSCVSNSSGGASSLMCVLRDASPHQPSGELK